MKKTVVILMAEDDYGHFVLTKSYLERMGVQNEIVWLADGQATLDFLQNQYRRAALHANKQYVLLLDIRMPKIDGIEVLQRVKSDAVMNDVPVVMLTMTENPSEIDKCYEAGCDAYIVKPVKYSSYVDAMRKIGLYPSMVAGGVELVCRSIA